ncbi:hypothetical protein ACTTAI_13000 [Rhodobacter capsulatus]|uniref:hypothetical protein n=1 Tax=Rhodobacter capsulatus TaxID=1061 RepID=UPI0040250A29
MKRFLLHPAAVLLVALCAWQIVALVKTTPLFPGPLDVAGALWEDGPRLIREIGHTLRRAVAGFALAALTMIPLGLAMGRLRGLAFVGEPRDCRLVMITDGRFKLITAPGFRPILFDLDADPGELTDLGADPAQAETVARLTAALLDWYRAAANRITVSDGWFSGGDEAAEAFDPLLDPGILIGYWDEAELEAEREKRKRWRAAQPEGGMPAQSRRSSERTGPREGRP